MNIDVTLPELGENIEKGDIVKWLVRVGDVVSSEQPVMEIETGKAVVEVPTPAAGRVVKLHFAEGDSADVGTVILSLESEVSVPAKADLKSPKTAPMVKQDEPVASPTQKEGAATAKAEKRVVPPTNGGSAHAAPGVKRIAREAGVDLSSMQGTGDGGRITVTDLATRVGGGTPAAAAPLKLPDFSQWGTIERKPMSTVRKMTAEHLSQTWSTTPQVTQFDRVDITDLDALRKKLAPKAEAGGGKLTMTAIAVKLCAIALEKFPQFNASVDYAGASVIYKKYVHIGVAVDTDRGLLVPVIRDCNKRGIVELSADLVRLSELARAGKLAPDQLQGGCFSISNLGGIGGSGFTPIVNGPEVAILGMSRASMEPVWRNDQFEPRLILPLALSYDHRLIDGADAARFLRFLCEAMEEPMTLLM